MENGMLACAVLIFVLVGKQEVESVNIKACVKRVLSGFPVKRLDLVDIIANTNNTIICEALNPSASIVWKIKRKNMQIYEVATCDPSGCTVKADTAQIDAQRNTTQSQLIYWQHDFRNDTDAKIICESRLGTSFSDTSCTFNVIKLAVLSNCHISSRLPSNAGLEGTCEYKGGQSSAGVVPTCSWYKKNNMGEQRIPAQGNVNRRNQLCTLQTVDRNYQPCKYTYSVLFYPGPAEKVIVIDDGCNARTTPVTTTRPTTTTTVTSAPASAPANQPKRISLTTSVQGGQAGSAIVLQRGQKNVQLTCRFDTIARTAGLLSWCKIGECPEGNMICSPTCPENIGQREVTQSCPGSNPCGMTLTVKKVTDCDGGRYSCFVFSTVNVSSYDAASVVVSVKDCKKNTYGPECADKCGRCAGNLTCNTITGHCPDCLDGWTPPLCTEAVPEPPLLTPNEQVAVGVAVGAPLTWGFISTIVQVWQVLGNAGWLPFLHMGGKEEEKEKKGEEDDESDEEEPPTKCSRFLKCIFCGGAGMCLLSFLFCISCGKLMSKKFSWRKDKDIQDLGVTEAQVQEDPSSQDDLDSALVVIQDFPVEGSSASTGSPATPLSEPQPDNPEENLEQQAAVIKQPKTARFTEQYFAKASWLENPHKSISIEERKSYSAFSRTKLHGYYSSNSDVQIKQSVNKRDDDTNKSDQKVNDDRKGTDENVVSQTGEAKKN